MTQQSQNKAYFFAALTVLMWSTVATAFKYTLAYATVLQMLTIASCSALLMLLLIVVLLGKLPLVLPSLKQYWRLSLIAGLLNPCLYYLILFEAYDRLPAQLAQPINMTWAIVLSVMAAVVLKQKIRRHDYLAATICYVGVLLIISQGGMDGFTRVDWSGIGLALLSTLIWASYWVLNMKDNRDPVIAMLLNFLIATPLLMRPSHVACFEFCARVQGGSSSRRRSSRRRSGCRRCRKVAHSIARGVARAVEVAQAVLLARVAGCVRDGPNQCMPRRLDAVLTAAGLQAAQGPRRLHSFRARRFRSFLGIPPPILQALFTLFDDGKKE